MPAALFLVQGAGTQMGYPNKGRKISSMKLKNQDFVMVFLDDLVLTRLFGLKYGTSAGRPLDKSVIMPFLAQVIGDAQEPEKQEDDEGDFYKVSLSGSPRTLQEN